MVRENCVLHLDGDFSRPGCADRARESRRLRSWVQRTFHLVHFLTGWSILVDTPLSESRFSEYLQGWVDETREEEHHDEVHFSHGDDDHDDDDEQHDTATVPDDEPYPEEKDDSNNEDNNESEELNAEANLNESENDNESQEPAQDDDDDDAENESTKEAENDDDDDDEADNQSPEADNKSENEVPSLFEDSTPFEEEVRASKTNFPCDFRDFALLKLWRQKPAVTTNELEKNVDDLFETLRELRQLQGNVKPKKNTKREVKTETKVCGAWNCL